MLSGLPVQSAFNRTSGFVLVSLLLCWFASIHNRLSFPLVVHSSSSSFNQSPRATASPSLCHRRCVHCVVYHPPFLCVIKSLALCQRRMQSRDISYSCSIAAIFALLVWLSPLLVVGQNRSRPSIEEDFDAAGIFLRDSSNSDKEIVIFSI